MRVFLDTNILISAALFPGSTPDKAYRLAVSTPNDAVVCDQVIDEMRRIFNRKFPQRMDALKIFLADMSTSVTIVLVPEDELEQEAAVRDVMDRPILRAAIEAGADVLITGDKDFLESGLEDPRILTAAQFCDLNEKS